MCDVPCTSQYVWVYITDTCMYMHTDVGRDKGMEERRVRERNRDKKRLPSLFIILADDGIPLPDKVRKGQWYQHIFSTRSKETRIKLI